MSPTVRILATVTPRHVTPLTHDRYRTVSCPQHCLQFLSPVTAHIYNSTSQLLLWPDIITKWIICTYTLSKPTLLARRHNPRCTPELDLCSSAHHLPANSPHSAPHLTSPRQLATVPSSRHRGGLDQTCKRCCTITERRCLLLLLLNTPNSFKH